MLSVLLALAVGISSNSSAGDKSTPLRGSLSGIVTADDYPPDALDLNQQGSVGVLVVISPSGAVSDCVVTASSGSPALDAQTCRLVWLRAKFIPARDRNGAPVKATYQQRISWRIGDDEGDRASSSPWMDRWIVHESSDGMTSCRTELGGALASGYAGPSQCPAYVAGIASSLSSAYPEVVIEQGFSVGAAPTVAIAPTDHLIGRELAQLDIDSAGEVSSCKLVETTGTLPPQISRACSIATKQYVPRKDDKGSASPFTAYYLVEIYGHSLN